MRHLFFITKLLSAVCCALNATAQDNNDISLKESKVLVFDTINIVNYLEVISKHEFDTIVDLSDSFFEPGRKGEVIDDSISVSRDSANLVFQLGNGKSVTYTDEFPTDHDYSIRYEYIRSVDLLDAWLISEQEWEEECVYNLVSKADGEIIYRFACSERIAFSPDKTAMFRYGSSGEWMGGSYLGSLNFYKIKEKSLNHIWHWNIGSENDMYDEYVEINGVNSLKWESNSSVVIQWNVGYETSKYNRLILK